MNVNQGAPSPFPQLEKIQSSDQANITERTIHLLNAVAAQLNPGALERRSIHLENCIASKLTRVVVEQAANGMGLVRHGAKIIRRHAERRQAHLDAETGT